MFTYEFPRENLVLVTDHANSLDVVILSIVATSYGYTMTTENEFPAEQLEHLNMTAV